MNVVCQSVASAQRDARDRAETRAAHEGFGKAFRCRKPSLLLMPLQHDICFTGT